MDVSQWEASMMDFSQWEPSITCSWMCLMSWGLMVASSTVLHSRTGASAASRARLEMSLPTRNNKLKIANKNFKHHLRVHVPCWQEGYVIIYSMKVCWLPAGVSLGERHHLGDLLGGKRRPLLLQQVGHQLGPRLHVWHSEAFNDIKQRGWLFFGLTWRRLFWWIFLRLRHPAPE